jgi:hypothetical protein
MAMSQHSTAQQSWWKGPHPSSWLALFAVVAGIFAVNACSYPFAAMPGCAARFFPSVAPAAIRWLTYTVQFVSIGAVGLVLPAIRRFGIHVVVYTSAAVLLLGAGIRCLALATPESSDGTRGVAAFVLTFVGTAVMAVSVAPFQVAGTLVSTTFSRQGRVFVHSVVRLCSEV